MKIRNFCENFILKHVSNKKRAILYKKWRKINIGNQCEIYKNVSFGSEPYLISIGDNVRITSGVKFCTHDGGMWVIRNLGINPQADIFGKIVIGNNVHIGWNAIIMPNVHIGNNVVIGVGSIVTHDVPDNSVVAGIPGRVIRDIDSYYKKNVNRILNTKNISKQEKEKIILKFLN